MTTERLNRPVIVFSRNYMPINRIHLKRAIVLLLTGKAEPIDFINENKQIAVHSPHFVLFVPLHIRLTVTHQERRGWKIPTVTRREVLRRDRHTCQYCGSTKNLTIDHVIPRSKGGGHTWDNVVTACERCNSHKGDRLPQQVGMTLRTQPKTPMHPAVMFADEFWQQQASHEKKIAAIPDTENTVI
ncbi:HNH endonuclease [Thioflexithrix psekupsensis]|uniref:HNH endonuclease n=1 Tax=Thioflexithrix psekupsensis TaxID=1570016 RepID=A0A251X9Z1_9GAMM|nr:HNH endonuclease [Thioflexithrix psekupsensis]OUD14999.1 HNH endonuclease [Thioflexithrix psekupsensis]